MKQYFSPVVVCFVVSAFFFITLSSPALAQQNNEELLEQLQAQIVALQSQIAALQGGQSSIPPLSKTLAFGDQGPQVRALQQRLNAEPGISVASSGAGSPGAETTYFGPATLQAVKAFQQKYSSQILAPLGLISPTGIVGPSTRAVLNQTTGTDQTSSGDDSTSSDDGQGTSSYETFTESAYEPDEDLYIRSQGSIEDIGSKSSNEVVFGGTLSITGGGFSESTRVVVGDTVIPSDQVTFHSSESLEVKVPDIFEKGIYNLVLIDGERRSNPSSKVIIQDAGAEAPSIESVEQTSESVILTVSNTTDSNTVHTNYKRFHDVAPSDGTLVISKDKIASSLGGRDYSGERVVYIQVINGNGISESVSETVQF